MAASTTTQPIATVKILTDEAIHPLEVLVYSGQVLERYEAMAAKTSTVMEIVYTESLPAERPAEPVDWEAIYGTAEYYARLLNR